MSHESGKVGDQPRGRGVTAGREAEFTVQDNVDSGAGRKLDMEHANAAENKEDTNRRPLQDQDRPLNGVAHETGGLEKHAEEEDELVGSTGLNPIIDPF